MPPRSRSDPADRAIKCPCASRQKHTVGSFSTVAPHLLQYITFSSSQSAADEGFALDRLIYRFGPFHPASRMLPLSLAFEAQFGCPVSRRFSRLFFPSFSRKRAQSSPFSQGPAAGDWISALAIERVSKRSRSPALQVRAARSLRIETVGGQVARRRLTTRGAAYCFPAPICQPQWRWRI